MRRFAATATLGIIVGISLLLMLAAGRCTQARTYHLEYPGGTRCHQHEPLSHWSLWRILTSSLVPGGLLMLGWRWCRRNVLPWLAVQRAWRGHAGIQRPSGHFPARTHPPDCIAEALADGLSGGQVMFG